MSFFPHEVYSRCLFGAHGQPLWTPQLKTQLRDSYQLEGLKIGDVGIVSSIDGSFDVLFNITLPRNEQPYPKLVGEDFVPVTLDPEADLATQDDAVSAHGVISSESVELISQEIHSCDQRPSSADYEFSLSTEDGAVLVLPEGAESCDLANEQSFLDEAIRHGVEWYECATHPQMAGRLIGNDSLYLITGFHKARSWSLGAARRNDSGQKKQRPIKYKVGQFHQDNVPARAYQWTATPGFTGRVGPTNPYEISGHICDKRLRRGVNQTVFIRGFRITVNKLLFLKTVSVRTRQGTFFGFGTYVDNLLRGRAAGPSQPSERVNATDNTVDQDSSVNLDRLYMDTRMTIDRTPGVSQTFHPGDSINQYLLKREPGAMVAITRDGLWIDMLQRGLLKVGDFARDRCLQDVLSKNYQTIVENGTVYLQHDLPYEHSFIPFQDSHLTFNHEAPGRAIPAVSCLESPQRTTPSYVTDASKITSCDISTLRAADALLPYIRRASWPSHPHAEYSTWMQTPPRSSGSPASEPPENAFGESDQDSDDDDVTQMSPVMNQFQDPPPQYMHHTQAFQSPTKALQLPETMLQPIDDDPGIQRGLRRLQDMDVAIDDEPEVTFPPSMVWSSPSIYFGGARLQDLDTGPQHASERLFRTDKHRAPVALSNSTSLTAPSSSTNVPVGDQRPTDGPEQPKKRKVHQCEHCGKRFPRPSGLASHMNFHLGAKPYKCIAAGCDKSFAVRSNAKRHLRIHGITSSASDALPVSRFALGSEDPMVTQVHDAGKQPSRYRWITRDPSLSHDGDWGRRESSSSAMGGSSRTDLMYR